MCSLELLVKLYGLLLVSTSSRRSMHTWYCRYGTTKAQETTIGSKSQQKHQLVKLQGFLDMVYRIGSLSLVCHLRICQPWTGLDVHAPPACGYHVHLPSLDERLSHSRRSRSLWSPNFLGATGQWAAVHSDEEDVYRCPSRVVHVGNAFLGLSAATSSPQFVGRLCLTRS